MQEKHRPCTLTAQDNMKASESVIKGGFLKHLVIRTFLTDNELRNVCSVCVCNIVLVTKVGRFDHMGFKTRKQACSSCCAAIVIISFEIFSHRHYFSQDLVQNHSFQAQFTMRFSMNCS